MRSTFLCIFEPLRDALLTHDYYMHLGGPEVLHWRQASGCPRYIPTHSSGRVRLS